MPMLDRDAVLRAIPGNWCDPILTGPKAVITGEHDSEQDIELVLNAVRARIEALPVTETK